MSAGVDVCMEGLAESLAIPPVPFQGGEVKVAKGLQEELVLEH
jgi:hypothetical protein